VAGHNFDRVSAWEDRAVTRAVLIALAIAYGAASVVVALDVAPNDPTTYAATSSTLAVADFVAGLGLIVAGCVVWRERPGASIGPLAILLGVVWFAPDWVGWEQGPPLVRSVAMLAPWFLLPLVLAFVRPLVPLFALAAVLSVAHALVYDPFLDPDCWSNCTENVFLVHAAPDLARALQELWLAVTIAGGVLVAAIAGRRVLSATRPARAGTWTVLVPTGLAGLAEAAYAISEPDPVSHAVFVARALAFALLAAGLVWTVVRQRRTRAAIARLADDLGEVPEPGSLRAALVRSLGDPGLAVAYPVPGSDSYVDAEGRPVVAEGRATTPIVRNGEAIALVVHDRALSEAEALDIGAAARLAVDNERLRAEALSQLVDLRASRARIVETGDTARQRIERDLHDGAQQRLLAVSYELRLARAEAEAAGDEPLAARLAAGGAEVQSALAELRDLAHGIYPAILTEAGLGPALWTLADGAPVPVEVGEVPEERLPEPVERAGYAVVAAAIEEGSGHLAVTVRREREDVTITVDGVRSLPVRIADRVGALGGRVALEDGALRAVIPCA
jgi:signal transduction histidine kinase